MAKATVQAALGPVALDSVRDLNRPEEERDFAERVLVICVLSILLTAPVGAILITLSGPRLLKKTTTPVIVEGWRRSARPSLRDISIIDEDDNGETT
ncbi:sodium/hydrogen exchanger 9B2-like [Zootermopsis nevadensis]|nr:sodium/hydrogen exchanger 9B2-like [Zootermopsis nevadensis]